MFFYRSLWESAKNSHARVEGSYLLTYDKMPTYNENGEEAHPVETKVRLEAEMFKELLPLAEKQLKAAGLYEKALAFGVTALFLPHVCVVFDAFLRLDPCLLFRTYHSCSEVSACLDHLDVEVVCSIAQNLCACGLLVEKRTVPSQRRSWRERAKEPDWKTSTWGVHTNEALKALLAQFDWRLKGEKEARQWLPPGASTPVARLRAEFVGRVRAAQTASTLVAPLVSVPTPEPTAAECHSPSVAELDALKSAAASTYASTPLKKAWRSAVDVQTVAAWVFDKVEKESADADIRKWMDALIHVAHAPGGVGAAATSSSAAPTGESSVGIAALRALCKRHGYDDSDGGSQPARGMYVLSARAHAHDSGTDGAQHEDGNAKLPAIVDRFIVPTTFYKIDQLRVWYINLYQLLCSISAMKRVLEPILATATNTGSEQERENTDTVREFCKQLRRFSTATGRVYNPRLVASELKRPLHDMEAKAGKGDTTSAVLFYKLLHVLDTLLMTVRVPLLSARQRLVKGRVCKDVVTVESCSDFGGPVVVTVHWTLNKDSGGPDLVTLMLRGLWQGRGRADGKEGLLVTSVTKEKEAGERRGEEREEGETRLWEARLLGSTPDVLFFVFSVPEESQKARVSELPETVTLTDPLPTANEWTYQLRSCVATEVKIRRTSAASCHDEDDEPCGHSARTGRENAMVTARWQPAAGSRPSRVHVLRPLWKEDSDVNPSTDQRHQLPLLKPHFAVYERMGMQSPSTSCVTYLDAVLHPDTTERRLDVQQADLRHRVGATDAVVDDGGVASMVTDALARHAVVDDDDGVGPFGTVSRRRPAF